MRHGIGSLQQQQALPRRCRKDSPAVPFLDDVLVIFLRLEAQQGESKAVLSGPRLSMAAARIATGLGQDGHDVVDEVQRTLGLGGAARDRQRGAGQQGAGEGVESEFHDSGAYAVSSAIGFPLPTRNVGRLLKSLIVTLALSMPR